MAEYKICKNAKQMQKEKKCAKRNMQDKQKMLKSKDNAKQC